MDLSTNTSASVWIFWPILINFHCVVPEIIGNLPHHHYHPMEGNRNSEGKGEGPIGSFPKARGVTQLSFFQGGFWVRLESYK